MAAVLQVFSAAGEGARLVLTRDTDHPYIAEGYPPRRLARLTTRWRRDSWGVTVSCGADQLCTTGRSRRRRHDASRRSKRPRRQRSTTAPISTKMHTYRDALTEVRSVWVLYPGHQMKSFAADGPVGDDTVLPIGGVGAVSLRPEPGGDVDLINSLVDSLSRLDGS